MIRVDTKIIILTLRELSDIDEQRRLWLSTGKFGQDISSFGEAICGLFDDSGLSVELDKDRLVITPDIDFALRDLNRVLKKIDGDRSPLEIINDPKFDEVRSLSKKALEVLLEFESKQQQ